MPAYRPNSFAHKMTLMALLAVAIAVGAVILSFLTLDTISSRSLLQNRLSTLADVVGQNTTAAVNFNDPAAAMEALQALQAEPPVVTACLYDMSNQLFAQYQRQRNAHSCPADVAQLAPVTGDYSSVVRPVRRHGEPVGTLFLKSDLQDLEKRRKRLLTIAGVLLVFALGIGGVSASFLQRKISTPVSDLARAMHTVTVDENFATRVVVSGTDELAQLGIGFNSMVSELERRERDKRSAEQKLQFQALNDALTGLPNRRLFTDRLTQILALAAREGRIVALLYIDLDGFKLVNDSLGHALGDTLLVKVAERLQSRVRHSDTLARLGGDEFTVILGTLNDSKEAKLVAQSLLDVLSEPFVIADHQLTIGASVGISIFPDNAHHAPDLMQQADSAMYAAKREGKNRAMYFTPEIGSLVRERLNLETQLRTAVARDQIQVYYQPEFDVTTGRLIRFEALARWFHPSLGTIPPDKFIPIAEESGLIVPLGAYIMERACREAVNWQQLAPYPIEVAVNVSSLQFRRDSFVEEVTRILEASGLEPRLLQLELTESIMLTGVRRTADTMKRLKALGVSLAIDDFGTGYSCLSYLPELPFDVLKIDRSFVSELHNKVSNQAMVHSLLALAHNVGMRVVVEGIETEEQLELIERFGGNEVQGYLMGRPTPHPAEQLSTVFEKHRPATQGLSTPLAGAKAGPT